MSKRGSLEWGEPPQPNETAIAKPASASSAERRAWERIAEILDVATTTGWNRAGRSVTAPSLERREPLGVAHVPGIRAAVTSAIPDTEPRRGGLVE